MATKKASSSKVAPKKRPTTKKPVKKVVAKATTVTAKTGGNNKKLTVGEKFAALRPGALIAEFFGTFVLAGAVISLVGGGLTGSVAIALILAVLVIVFGVISGAHLNPAITIAQYVNRKIDGVKTIAYIFAQVLGAVAAFGLLLGIFNAYSPVETLVEETLVSNGYETSEDIKAGGGVVKYLAEKYDGMTIDEAVEALQLSDSDVPQFVDHQMSADKEWVDLLAELLGAIIFGLGVGYAVYSEKKNSIETGLAVGLSLLAGLVIGGTTVILNPAVAGAIGGFEAVNPFGAEAMTFWWPVFTYVCATVIGLTAGFTLYRVALQDALAKK